MDSQNFIIQVVCLAFFCGLEWIVPYFEQRQGKLIHDLRNLSVAAINGILGTVVFAGLLASVLQWVTEADFGLLNWCGLEDSTLRLIAAFLLIDCWMYWWHRINHIVPFLWRFHQVHHTDQAMDSTTGFRFHPIEILFSYLARLVIIPIFGIEFQELIFYEVVMQVLVIFHHSNVHLTRRTDDIIWCVFVSPHMHKVHHSKEVHETNSNYSVVFSFWDRLFGSHIHRTDPYNIRYGTGHFEESRWQTFLGILKIPFGKSG